MTEQLNFFKIRDTSRHAYNDIKTNGTQVSQAMKIFNYIKSSDGVTRNMISNETGIGINAVCGRVNELLKSFMIRENGKMKDIYTKRQNYKLTIY